MDLRGQLLNQDSLFHKLLADSRTLAARQKSLYETQGASEFEYGSSGRIGFAWTEVASLGDGATQLAANLARAIHDAYVGDSPGLACVDNDGAGTYYYGCPPAPRPYATINTRWDDFKHWQSE
jgi:hypothetical protein